MTAAADDRALPVRRVTEAGRLPEALAVIHAAFEQYRGVIRPESGALSETVESLAARLETGMLLAVEQGGRIVACTFAQPKGDALYFDRLAVHPSARGLGLARRLIEAVGAEARTRGLARISLGVRIALADNVAFFRRMGFVEVARKAHLGFSEPTSLDMEKPLA